MLHANCQQAISYLVFRHKTRQVRFEARIELKGAEMRAFVLFLIAHLCLSNMALGLDTGLLEHYLNKNVELPSNTRAITSEVAREAVATHFRDVVSNARYQRSPRLQYWQDYGKVIKKYSEISRALPVFVGSETTEPKVARYLVGFNQGSFVYGFVAVDPVDASIQAKLMWDDKLEPIWKVPLEVWKSAASVNDISELVELVPPYAQFTTGIPVNPQNGEYTIVDGVIDLPYKTQEERSCWCERFNEQYGTELNVTLNHSLGRRTATSKCLSVAVSCIADWWAVQTGGNLPSYRNGAGGQKEYGFNPRLCETLYFKNAISEAGLAERTLQNLGKLIGVGISASGQFKLVGRDRVTGEPIAYSPRGYARSICESKEEVSPDPLVPSLIQYETTSNHFYMDQPPMPIVLDENFLARVTEARDAADFGESERFSLSPWAGKKLSREEKEAMLIKALDTWGPLYAQHVKRSSDGNPSTGLLASGVHACMMVGYGSYNERLHFVYKETFGEATERYVEDSFLGPSYRIMPAEYFWQVIAFPHHLYVDLSVTEEENSLSGLITIRTNRNAQPINVEHLVVLVDGIQRRGCLVPTQKGSYEFTVDGVKGKRLEVRVTRRYFADRLGRNAFGRGATLSADGNWTIDEEALEPIDGEALGIVK